MFYSSNSSVLGYSEVVWFAFVVVFGFFLGWSLLQNLHQYSRLKFSKNKIWSEGLPLSLTVFFAGSLGLSVSCILFFLLGFLGLLSFWGMNGALGLVFLMLVVPTRNSWSAFAKNACSGWGTGFQNKLELILFLTIGLASTWLCIKPAGNWDDTSFHLPLARFYLQQHALNLDPWLRFPLFPANGDLLFSWSLSWGGFLFAQVMATAVPIFFMVLGLYGLCQKLLHSKLAGWVAILLFLLMPPARETFGWAYIDTILALFCFAGMTAILLASFSISKEEAMPWVAAGACLMGAASGTKPFGAIIAIFIGVYVLYNWGIKSRALWLYMLLLAVTGLGWYIRSFLISGDPVNPIGGNVFGYFLWNAQDLKAQVAEQASLGVITNPLWLFKSLHHAGIAFMAFGFLTLFQKESKRLFIKPMVLIIVAYLICWQWKFPPDRYTLQVLPMASVLAVVFFYNAGIGRLLTKYQSAFNAKATKVLASLLLALVSVVLGFYGLQQQSIQTINWQSNLNSRLGYQPIAKANQYQAEYGNRLMSLGFENSFYFDGVVIGGLFGPGRYSQMMDCDASGCRLLAPFALRQMLNHFNARMMVVNGNVVQFTPWAYEEYFRIESFSDNAYLLLLQSKPSQEKGQSL